MDIGNTGPISGVADEFHDTDTGSCFWPPFISSGARKVETMTKLTRTSQQLTYRGAALVLQAALAKAIDLDVPQNISIVDAGGNLLAFARMDGARLLAQHSSISKAQSAVSLQMPTGHLPAQFGLDLALATGCRSTNLPGGLPIECQGIIIGGIGVSSGADADDIAVAAAGRDAIVAELTKG